MAVSFIPLAVQLALVIAFGTIFLSHLEYFLSHLYRGLFLNVNWFCFSPLEDIKQDYRLLQ